jgi:hypothetical protein
MNGLSLQWYVPDLTWAFVQVFSLVSIASTSLVAVPLAAVAALVYWSGLIIAHRAARALTLIRSLSSALSQLFGP